MNARIEEALSSASKALIRAESPGGDISLALIKNQAAVVSALSYVTDAAESIKGGRLVPASFQICQAVKKLQGPFGSWEFLAGVEARRRDLWKRCLDASSLKDNGEKEKELLRIAHSLLDAVREYLRVTG